MTLIQKSLLGLCLLSLSTVLFAQTSTTPSKPSAPMEKASTNIATFAGGCFWCMEPPFDNAEGVLKTISGYMGGSVKNPTYEQVTSGTTGHAEVVQVTYDPQKVTYAELLDIFWRNIDPTTKNQQFVDRGTQYRTAVFYHNAEQQQLAEASKKMLEAEGRFDAPIVTEITEASEFYPAEGYHQDYYQTNPVRYKFYRYASGRDQYLDQVWKDERK